MAFREAAKTAMASQHLVAASRKVRRYPIYFLSYKQVWVTTVLAVSQKEKRMHRFRLLSLVLLLLLGSLGPAPVLQAQAAGDQPDALPDGWQQRTLATRGKAGQRSLLLTDSRGEPHILYLQDTASTALRHAWSDGLVWRDEVVHSFAPGQFLGGNPFRFAIRGEQIAAAWAEPSGGQVTVATRGPNGWSSQNVPLLSQSSSFSLGLLEGRPALAYYSQSRLSFARLDANGQWQNEIVDDSGWVGDFNSIAISADGIVHVAYLQSDTLDFRYARRTPAAQGDGGSWAAQTLHSYGNAGVGTAIALDSNGHPHMAYVVHENFGMVNLYYVYEVDGGGWSPSLNAASNRISSNPELVLNSQDQATLFFWRYGQDAGVYLTAYESNAGLWSETPLGLENAGGLGRDSRDRLLLSYYDAQFQDLKFAIQADVWSDRLEVATLLGNGVYFGAALNPDNGPVFSLNRGGLERREWRDGAWASEVISPTVLANQHSSLAFSREGNPHVAYYQGDTGDLIHGQRVDGSWQFTTVDQSGDVGLYPRLLLRNGDSPVIVYWDSSNNRLKVAERVNQNWLISAQQDGPPLNSESSRFDAAGFANDGGLFISYYDEANSDLRLARVLRRGSDWTWSDSLIGTNEGDTGRASALAIGGNGLYLALAYSHAGDGGSAVRYGWLWANGISQWTSGQLPTSAMQGKRVLGVDVALKSGSHLMPRAALLLEDGNGRREVWLASKDGEQFSWRFEALSQGMTSGLGRVVPPVVFAEGADRVAWHDQSTLYLRSRYRDEDRPTASASGSIRPGNPALGVLCACLILACWDELNTPNARAQASEQPLETQLHAQFAATPDGQRYVELYRAHGREIYERIAGDPVLLWDTWRALENFTPALVALAAGEGETMSLTGEMTASALDIWQRLAAAASPTLAAAINAELSATNNLADFTNKTVAESAEQIGVDPQALARLLLYLPLTQR
jgi:hypothetical protein